MESEKPHDHELRINTVLGKVHRREGGDFDLPDNRTPLTDLLAKELIGEGGHEESAGEWAIRDEAFSRLLGYIFADGPHPGVTMRRLYALAYAKDKSLIRNMSMTDLAQMFGETKAAQSWRINRMYTDYLKSTGMRGCKIPGQKSESARETYSDLQQGNKNRTKGSGKRRQQRKKV